MQVREFLFFNGKEFGEKHRHEDVSISQRKKQE
jgi:hypothetical protein